MDEPRQNLRFSLNSDAPEGTAIDSITGLLSWKPSVNQIFGTNTLTVTVTDDAEAPLSDSKSFSVVVLGPRISGITRDTSNNLKLEWTSVPGAEYQLQSSAALTLSPWQNLGAPVTATANTASTMFLMGDKTAEYFRIIRMK